MVKKYFFLILILLQLSYLAAQPDQHYFKYSDEAAEEAILFRGTSPLAYLFIHTGTYFAYNEVFQKGTLRYNNKIYSDLLMNLNSHLDELYIYNPHNGRYVVLNKNLVDNFSLGEREFLNIREAEGVLKGMSPGYYEVLYKNKSVLLYKKIKKTYLEKVAHHLTQSATKIERTFVLSEHYFIDIDGQVKGVKRFADLIRHYSSKRSGIREFVRQNSLDVKSNKDHVYPMVLQFIESNEGTVTR